MDRSTFLQSLALIPFAEFAATTSNILSFTDNSMPGKAVRSATMWTYLWDLADEGYREVLGRLHDHGVSGISLATAYHAGKFLAPHNPKRRVVFTEDGTVYFRPKQKEYGLIWPRVNSLVGQGHGLDRTKREADRLGMKTHAWVVCCHNTPLGWQHPAVACENAFGDKLYHNLCPSNDEVRKYLRVLIRDIASCGVDVIELEALQFQGYTHGFHHEREGIELNQVSRFLLGLCFCSSCRKKAKASGVEIESLQRFTRRTLESFFADPEATSQQYSDLAGLPQDLLDPFLSWRTTIVYSLLEDLVDVAGRVKLRQLMHVDPMARRLVSVDPARAATLTGGLLALAYVRKGEALRAPINELHKLVGDAEIRAGLQVGLPESGGRSEFLGRMSVLRELGIADFNFYNYGFIPYQNFQWVKESIAG